jgi:hypothetical protein
MSTQLHNPARHSKKVPRKTHTKNNNKKQTNKKQNNNNNKNRDVELNIALDTEPIHIQAQLVIQKRDKERMSYLIHFSPQHSKKR